MNSWYAEASVLRVQLSAYELKHAFETYIIHLRTLHNLLIILCPNVSTILPGPPLC